MMRIKLHMIRFIARTRPHRSTRKMRIEGGKTSLTGLFLLLLVVVAGLMVLFASGTLIHGLEAPFIFLIYVIAGLLVAVLCFGILESTGTFEGRENAVSLRLGGAIVSLIVVAGGGSAYEKYVKISSFSVRIVFHDAANPGDILPLNGIVTLYVGAAAPSAKIVDGSALFQDIAPSSSGLKATIGLLAPGYKSAQNDGQVTLTPNSVIDFRVSKKPAMTPESESKVSVTLIDAQSWKLPPDRPFRSLDINLNLLSESEGDVPIDKTGVVSLLKDNNFVPMKEIKMDVSGGLLEPNTVLPPNVPTRINLSGMLTPDDVLLLESGSFYFQVGIRYAGSAEARFLTDPKKFDHASIRFEGK